MIASGDGHKGKTGKVVTATKPKTKRSSKVVVEKVPRTKNTPINDNRMKATELQASLSVLSENLVLNVEYVLQDRGWSWKDLAIATGLGTSTVYQVKNHKTHAGVQTAALYAKTLNVDPWMLFEPHTRFVASYKKIKQALN